MQGTNDLMPMFSYSFIIMLFFLILIIVNVFILFKTKKKEGKHNKTIIVEPSIKDKSLIKEQYLKEIDLLKNKLNNNEISSRKAYQSLSILIRTFIFEMTSVNVLNYTLEEIKVLKMPVLTALVEDYYDPEFAVDTKGNIESSIEKTREVIARWI